MGGGILNGLILGLLVSGVILGAVSLSTPLPERSAGGAAAPAPAIPASPLELLPAEPQGTAEGAAEVEESAEVTAPAPVPAAQPVPADPVPVPVPTPTPAAPAAPAVVPEAAPVPGPESLLDPAPAPAPEPEAAAPAPAAPPVGDTAGSASLTTPAADPAPSLPRADAPPLASSPVPPAPVPATDSAPAPQAATAEPADTITAAPDAPAPAVIAAAPSPRFSTAADGSAGGEPPRRLAIPQAQDAPAVTDTAVPPPAPEPVPEPIPEPAQVAAVPDAPVPDAPRRLPQVAPPPAPAPAPQADADPAPRLPQAGITLVDPAPAPAPLPAPEPVPEVLAEPGPPVALRDHAVAFEADPGTPLLAVVLIDDADSALDPAALTDLSFPVSFAIDPMRPDAAARAEAFRAAGFEVVILGAPAIPEGAAPSDVEVALAIAQERLPEAVALMDDPAGRIQGDRPVLDATVGALAGTGHGLLAYPRGLNAAEETARRTGVPAATIFRLLDDEDQRAPVITRFLGRAAFAAVQEGAVVVVGRTRPDTVTALFSWALASRTEGVELAPVSAVLQRLSE